MKKQVEFMRTESTPMIGERCTLFLSNGTTVQTSRVIALSDRIIETKNTVYVKRRDFDSSDGNSGKLYNDEQPLVEKTVYQNEKPQYNPQIVQQFQSQIKEEQKQAIQPTVQQPVVQQQSIPQEPVVSQPQDAQGFRDISQPTIPVKPVPQQPIVQQQTVQQPIVQQPQVQQEPKQPVQIETPQQEIPQMKPLKIHNKVEQPKITPTNVPQPQQVQPLNNEEVAKMVQEKREKATAKKEEMEDVINKRLEKAQKLKIIADVASSKPYT